MEADKPNKIPCNTPNLYSDGPPTSCNMIKNEKDDGIEDSKPKLATSLEKNLNNSDQQAKNIQLEESLQGYPNKSSDGPSNTKAVGNVTAEGRNENDTTSVNQVGQLKTVSEQGAVPVPISITNQVPTTLSMSTTNSDVTPVPISVASSTPIRTSHVPVSISVLQAPYRRPIQGQLQGTSKSPIAIAPLIKTTEIVSVPSASHTLAYFSEKVSVVKNLTTVSTVQALQNSTKTTPTIAPRNTKSRKLNYKFISTAAQKTPSSNGNAVISPDPIKTSGFETNTQISSANGGGGLSNLFKSGPKHVAKVVPDCFADKVKDSSYKCLGCGDSYNFQSSLNLHINRCSSLIKYKCPFCNVTKHFFNKCSLFIHAREHARITKKPFELRANLANLSVLPTQQDTNFFCNADNKNETDHGKTPVQIVSTTSSSMQPSVNLKTDDRKTGDNSMDRSRDYLKDGMKMCLICMEKFTPNNTKVMHFKRETKRLVCEFCDQLLFNPCMAELHKNYHLHKQPLQCPDCGLVSATEKEAYQHIQQSCFHMSRKVLVRCSVCNIYVSSFKVYQNHLLDRHAESFYKCVECQLAYRSVETLKCHTVVEHKSSTISSMCNIILKCPLCETVFGNKKQLTAHIQSMHTYSDLSETKVVHECSHCGKLFQQLSSLDNHMLATHKNCAGHFHCEFCNRALQFSDLASHKRHCSLKLQTKLKNSEDNASMSKDTEVSAKSQPGECHDSGCSSKKHPEGHKCLLCTKDGTNMGFKSKQDLDAHYLSLKHKEAVLKNAIEMATTSTAGTGVDERKRKADNQESVAPLKKLKIVVPKKDFKCALCDFTCPARADFKKHLVDKHDANGALQCHECGLSFRASPSHKMHLRAVHKIFAMDQYFDEENANVMEDTCIEDKSEKKTKLKTSPVTQIVKKFDDNLMECQVCYKVFDLEIDLRTHMRNHGMAFIKSKRKMSMDNKETK